MILPNIFTGILRMSIIAALVILAVFALNWLLKRLKAPALLVCALWLVVLARLLLPISFSSAFSLLAAPPLQQPLHIVENFAAPVEFTAPNQPQPGGYTPTQTLPTNVVEPPAFQPPVEGAVSKPEILNILPLVWAGVATCLLLYGLVSYLILKIRLRTATRVTGNIYEIEHISGPFVCGLLKPHIYLPLNLNAAEKAYITLHEQIHIRRRDYLLKPLWYVACCLHWFNPLAWLAFKQMGHDMELSCDEAVLRELGSSIKADYSESLLALTGQKMERAFSPLAVGPLAFGENNTKERVRRVLGYKKPALWLAVLAGLAVIICAVVLLSNPRQQVEMAEDFSDEAAIILPQDIKAATLSSYSEGAMSVPVYLSYYGQPKELDSLCQLLTAGESQAAILASDTPNADAYLRIMLSAVGESATFFIYQQESRYFIEQPYICLSEIDEKTYEALQDIYVVANRNWTQRNTQSLFTGFPYSPYSIMRQGDYLTTARRYLKDAQEIELVQQIAENHRQATATWPSLSWDDIPQEGMFRLTISPQDGSETEWYLIYRYQGLLYIQYEYNGHRSLVDEDLFGQMQALLTEEDLLSTQRETLERSIWYTSDMQMLRQALLLEGKEDALPTAEWYGQMGRLGYILLGEDALIYEPTFGTGAGFCEGVICLPPRLRDITFEDDELSVSGYCLSATFHLSPENLLSIMEVSCLNIRGKYELSEEGFYTMTGGGYGPSQTMQYYFDQPQQEKMMPLFSAPMQQLQSLKEYDEEAVKAEIERLLWQYIKVN